jgi:hypothetical protein
MARGKGTPAGYAPQPAAAPAGGQYGDKAKSIADQGAVPLPNMAAGMAGAGPQPAGPAFAPGEVPLDMPSARPNEPITEGASFGPGRNLTDLGLPKPPTTAPLNPELFSKYLPALEAVASGPDSSVNLRQFVRQLRARMPPDFDPTAGH